MQPCCWNRSVADAESIGVFEGSNLFGLNLLDEVRNRAFFRNFREILLDLLSFTQSDQCGGGLEIGDVRALPPIQGFEFRVGSGLLVIAVGGVFLFVAALLDRGPWVLRSRP